jgi:DNA-binding SARP family transcriptional activator/streptogramin lyase
MVEFRILGPLEVVVQGGQLPLPRLKERIVLAVLLLHANEFVSRERLIDDLWGDEPPPTARKAVAVYVSQLRKRLTRNGADPIATAEGGYRLELGLEQLDAARAQQLLASAREGVSKGELDSAAERFRDALSLWRGPTLAGLQLESLGRDEVARLDELRLAALMDRIDCDVALGRHKHVLGELHVLVREHPLRERLRAQQMLALYRADRQAEALDAYAQARRTLVEELGIEPSPDLQRLHQGILRQDPSLETPTGTADVNGPVPTVAAASQAPAAEPDETGSRRRLRPRRWQLALAALVIAAASAAAAILSTSAGGTPHVVPNSLVRLDPRTGKVTSVVRVGVEPGPIVLTPSAMWTANHGDRTISRYDLRTHTVQSRGGFPRQPFDIVADADGNVWVSSKTPIVTRLAAGVGGTSAGPLYPSKTETIRVPGPGVGYEALGAGYVWATVGPLTIPGEDDRLSLIDLASNRVVGSMRLGRAVTAIAFGDGAAWVGTFINEPRDRPPPWTGPSWLYVIRAGARRAQSYRLETGDSTGPLAIAVGERHVWVLMCGTCNAGASNQTLLEIDPDTRQVIKRIPLPHRQPAFLAAGAGFVWLTNQADGSVMQLDPKTDRIVRTIPVGNTHASTCGIAATHDAVWVAIGDKYCDTIGR